MSNNYEDDLWMEDDGWEESGSANGQISVDLVSQERFNLEVAALEGKNVSPGEILRAEQAVELDEVARKLVNREKMGWFALRYSEVKRIFGWNG